LPRTLRLAVAAATRRGLPYTSRMVASSSFAEFLSDQLAPLGRLTMRRMFGKTGVFCDGCMLGMVQDNTLYFRVDEHNQAAFKVGLTRFRGHRSYAAVPC
jgi:hypothetical protein